MTPAPTDFSPRSYFVTGAGSGVGLAVVQALSNAGHRVFAGARRDGDLAHLATLPGVTAVRLDLLDAASAMAAKTTLAAAGVERLDGLVNSAGIGEIGHLVAGSDADVQRTFETNVFGLMRITRELMPLLLAARGRVVNIGSMGGQITHAMYGPYTMSKHALEAYSECLRQEGAPHGLKVSIVQPGAVATRIGASAGGANAQRLAATPPPFDQQARQVLQAPPQPRADNGDQPESATHRRPAPPEHVADVVIQALTARAPQARYLVGTRGEGERVLRALTERLIDAATSSGQQRGREDLLAWVDAAWRERFGEAG
jgi:NAD(P)-dependent dehydrogenase (short-subunit alcohol dehydrogenase family)